MLNFNHLKETKTTWWKHFSFAFPEAIGALWIGLVMIIHSIFPFILHNGIYDRYIRSAIKRLEDDQERWN